jgi:predicted lipid-binding transport protein (Tim44 family)
MDWALVSYTSEPVVLAARAAPVDLDGNIMVAQVTLRIDSTQALHVTDSRSGKREKKEQRTVENWVFERHLPVKQGWRVKERIETTQPSVEL